MVFPNQRSSFPDLETLRMIFPPAIFIPWHGSNLGSFGSWISWNLWDLSWDFTSTFRGYSIYIYIYIYTHIRCIYDVYMASMVDNGYWYPLVMNNSNKQFAMDNSHRNGEFSHSKWWFSIVLWHFNFTRGFASIIYHEIPVNPIKTPLNHHKTTIDSH